MQNFLISTLSLEELKSALSEALLRELMPHLVERVHEKHGPTEFLTRKQASELLGVSLVTLGEWTKQGTIQGYRISSRVRYKRTELEACVKKIRTFN